MDDKEKQKVTLAKCNFCNRNQSFVKKLIACANAEVFRGKSIILPCLSLTNKSVAPLNAVVITGFPAANASRMNLLAGS